MSNKVFGQGYADQYDLLYSDKNYESECDMLETIFQRYANHPVDTILDLGCGTGNHAIPLSRRGYQITGIDRSPDMLQHAKEKTAGITNISGIKLPSFFQGDVLTLDLGRTFDVVLMMFAVLGYQVRNEDVFAALRTVRRHLNPGGLFIFDAWYGPAVLAIRPSERIKIAPLENGQTIRSSRGELDIFNHVAEINYHTWWIINGRLAGESLESHVIRYFFPQEINMFMQQSQLNLIDIGTFGKLESAPTEETWNVLVIGNAI